jgi:hypothetical protein
MSENFFSKSSIYSAIWTLSIGFLCFIGGLCWKQLAGPDVVRVLKDRNNKDTTITLVQIKPDSSYFFNLFAISKNEIRSIKSPGLTSKLKDSLINRLAANFQRKYDSLFLIAKMKPLGSSSVAEIIPTSNGPAILYLLKVKRPKFNLPGIVLGYTEGQINYYANLSINKAQFLKTDNITIDLSFKNQETLSKISPIFVDIVEPKSEHSVYFIWGEQYEANGVFNKISFPANFKPGKYILTVGFYLLSEINTKYPPLYSRKISIEII